jgi:glycosyltransferase involved in cell wall biosynthesis
MKINFITTNLAPFRIDWLDEIAKQNNIVQIFYSDENAKDVNKIYITRRPRYAKYENISMNIFLNLRLFNFYKLLSHKSDLFIIDGYGSIFLVMVIVIKLILLQPFILSVDGGFIKKENFIKYRVKHFIISSARYYLSTSKATDNFLLKYGAKRNRIFRHKFSPLFKQDIDCSIKNTAEKKELKSNINMLDKFTVIGVGKFIYDKGFDVLLKALAFVKSDVQLILIGGEPIPEYLNIIKTYDLHNVRFVGFCNKIELKKYYEASDVFILPTRGDVWGLVINEAMASGLPVITTDKCIAGSTLVKDGENGFIIHVNDYMAIARYIDCLAMNSRLLKDLSINSLKKISPYNIEKIAKDDIVNFNKILDR